MKNLLLMAAVLMTSLTFGAAQNDLRLMFWSNGPDKYQDGSVVADGEMYALVWVKDGAEFAGFKADGSLAGDGAAELLACGPWALNGGCRPVLHLIAADDAPKYADGSYRLVVLDTRNADGTVSAPAHDADGKVVLTVVNGSQSVAETAGRVAGLSADLKSASGILIDAPSAVPADAPRPQITGLEMVTVNGQRMMRLTVRNTVPYLRYKAAAVDVGSAAAVEATGAPVNGADGDDREVEVLIPAEGNSGFYKVIRN